MEATVADLSYAPNDALAQMIVDAWVDESYREALLQRVSGSPGIPTAAALALAKEAVAACGLQLERAVVISEREFDNTWTSQDEREVVFVLPNQERVKRRPPKSLLETAKFLMAVTPHGI
jgi:hypothetical protein